MNSRRSLFQMTPVVKNLIIINLIVWVAMIIFPHQIGAKLNQYAALYYFSSPDFNPLQLVTYMFVHDMSNAQHVLFNMFTLWMFGTSIEMLFGSKRFLFYYLTCGVGAALIQQGVYALMIAHNLQLAEPGALEILNRGMYNPADPYMVKAAQLMFAPTVGASGAIYGILLAFGMMFPNRELFIMFVPIPVKAKYMVIIWAVIELGMGAFGSGSVAHFCHLGGMLAGLILILWWRYRKSINGPYV